MDGLTAHVNLPPVVRSELDSSLSYAIGSASLPSGCRTGEVIAWKALLTVSTRPDGAVPLMVEWYEESSVASAIR